ncbi:single-stranded DNA-binding protein [Selenomonadales bacterium OttesenSCG-928-I06]|nr:single-stranded DNA-binding protein [Selenomonadales bacterium OttesenSCG-928-I06]
MNRVILTGRLTQDPEVRYTQSGKAVASFSIAVDRYMGQGNERSVDFIPIVAWERLAETCGNNLTKGRAVLIEGRLQIRSYETNDGQKRRVAEVIASNLEFMDRKTGGSSGQSNEDSGSGGAGSFGRDVVPEEDIPF